jgi:hypothetical protein
MMVTSSAYFNNSCCYDYGNAETDNHADGRATMEAVYFGNWKAQGKGAGNGPWVMADMENGLYAGPSFAENPNDPSFTAMYVTGMVIGRSGSFAPKGGDAQSGLLTSMYDGARQGGISSEVAHKRPSGGARITGLVSARQPAPLTTG